MSLDNKRSFFRINLPQPLGADLKIIGTDHIDQHPKLHKAAIIDISAGGARFYTHAPLPDDHNLLAELKFLCMGKELRPYGVIVRSSLPEPGHCEYSLQFSLDDTDTADLAGTLNQLAIRLRKVTPMTSCSFLTPEEAARFFPLTACLA
ncbi:PilZ domain-containing protein [Paenibacillus sp. UNCCL117]|uniref:PilZ domain-containing protein n=1 Tax=unclassified Paenibacillus TaxID=185978 RepID=UPI0008912332|nr:MULTISPECIES: PilZ domain-containing protein [unclassified Paenibacillus]SDC77781.1 PilZ domain-containing protein [Paenibacillus sp. cl123]SFW25902.1 PilZ domain-containing protein [Paenibacillus sp. UNCCL117]